MTRTEKGEEHRRAALRQDTISIAVADFEIRSQDELGWGLVKFLEWRSSETLVFTGNVGIIFDPKLR